MSCPKCGSAQTASIALKDPVYEGCGACRTVWEALPADAPADVDGRPQPFRKACDNCAFRQGSPERADPEQWQGLTEAIAYQEKAFYCHKGVPLNAARDGFQYPKHPNGMHIRDDLRVCAGFIAWWKGLTKQADYIPGLTVRPGEHAEIISEAVPWCDDHGSDAG